MEIHGRAEEEPPQRPCAVNVISVYEGAGEIQWYFCPLLCFEAHVYKDLFFFPAMPLGSLCRTVGRFPPRPPAASPAGKIPVPRRDCDRDRNRNPSDAGARCQLGQRAHGWPGGDGWFGNENLRPGVPDLAFLSSAARPRGRFGGSPAQRQRINRKELSARVQLGLLPDICSPSGSKEVPVPLDGTVCGSPSRMRERGTPARHRDPQPGFSPLVSGLASLETPDCTTGDHCVCLPGRERLRVGGSGAAWGLCVGDGAWRDPPCCRDCGALPSADSRAGERLARLGLCVPPASCWPSASAFPHPPSPAAGASNAVQEWWERKAALDLEPFL